MNRRIRAVYPAEFKREAVERAKRGDRSVRSLEIELGLSANLLRQWVQQYDRLGGRAFVSKVAIGESEPAASAEGQIRQLQRQVARLEEERTILKKALKLLSQDA